MNWYKIFYLFSLADKINCTFFVLALICSIIFLITLFTTIATVDGMWTKEVWATWRKWAWRSAIFSLIAWSLWAFIPNKKDMVLIIAGGAVGEFITTDSSARQLPSDITNFLHTAIQNEIGDMKLDQAVKQELGIETPKEKFVSKLQDMTKEQIIQYLQTDTTVTLKN